MGDLVLARDPVTMESGWKPVLRTSVSENREVLRLELVGADGKADSLVVTPNHPFWGSEGTWRFASELRTGDIVLAASGWLLVKDTLGLAGGARVYNFEVADWHTYFVGDELAWVHNGGPACPVAAKGVQWTAHGGKHVASAKTPWNQVVASTKSGPAKYLPGTNVEALERSVWAEGSQVTNGKPWKVMEFGEDIGASGGKASRWMRVEESGGTIHGHPITEAEFGKLTR